MEPLTLIIIIVCFILLITIMIAVLKLNSKNILNNINTDETLEFETFYEKLVNINNDELTDSMMEVKKENAKKKKVAGIGCFIVDIILVVYTLVAAFSDYITYNGMSSILSAIIFGVITNIFIIVLVNLIFSKKLKEYNKKYKEIIISQLISNFYDCLEYFPNNAMPENEYKKLNYEYYDKYKSEDYLEAKINAQYNIKMAEILTEEVKETTDEEGNRTTTTESIFHGIFSKITLEKRVIDELRIMRNGQLFFETKTKMDSTLFEKYFDVKSSDRIVAMQLLTSDIMEDLINIQNKYGILFDIVIQNNEVYLRFYTGNMFEPGSFNGNILNKNLIQQYYFVMKFTYVLSNKMISIINDTSL